MGVDRIQRGWEPLREAITVKRQLQLSELDAQGLIYRAFTTGKMQVKLLKAVHKEFFIAPKHEDFREPSMWSLENAFTNSFKELKPIQQYQMTAKLGKFLSPYNHAL